jgi:hypothetical protein
MPPPTGYPQILVTNEWSAEPDQEISPGVAIEGGALVLHGRGASIVTGQSITTAVVRDVVIDTVLRADGTLPGEGFGVFCRQSAPARYVSLRVSTSGLIAIATMDGTETLLAAGPLAPGMAFDPEPGAPNRLTVVACGPAITFVLNSMVVTSVKVDERYGEGHAGVLLEQRDPASTPRLAVDWFQVRSILTDM